ncbi:MAG: hypothetical protein DWQ08_09830 [Proteobacteria bacterium]|nr:MAG: hypothetical protein DWQ08_09830 [Pseudomonadota bacterium]
MKKHIRKWQTLVTMVFALPALVFAAGPEVNVDSNGVAIHGHDPVAYFEQGAAVKGVPEYRHEFQGAVYHFSGAKSRDTFAANPEKYVPEFGGYCAMGTVMGKKLDVDPNSWRIVDGKLYLNVNADVQKRWLSDVEKHIAQAEAKWPELRNIPASQLD